MSQVKLSPRRASSKPLFPATAPQRYLECTHRAQAVCARSLSAQDSELGQPVGPQLHSIEFTD